MYRYVKLCSPPHFYLTIDKHIHMCSPQHLFNCIQPHHISLSIYITKYKCVYAIYKHINRCRLFLNVPPSCAQFLLRA